MRAALHEDGNGSVTLADAFEARDTRQEAEFILNFLQNLGYYDGTGFLQQFVLNFWFTNALGALTVYPQQVPILALYDLLLNNANRSWQRHREDRAFFLPKSSTQVLTRTGKKQFGNGLAKAIFRDGGPLVRRDSKELVTQALAKMGYIDSGLNRDFQEAILVFVNVNTNKLFGILELASGFGFIVRIGFRCMLWSSSHQDESAQDGPATAIRPARRKTSSEQHFYESTLPAFCKHPL